MRIELFRQICMNFNREPSEDVYRLWNEELINYDDLYVEQAFKNILKNEKYFPTLSRVIEEITNLPSIEITEDTKKKRMEKRGIIPQWLRGEVINERMGISDYKTFEDFNDFIEEFRNEKINKKVASEN